MSDARQRLRTMLHSDSDVQHAEQSLNFKHAECKVSEKSLPQLFETLDTVSKQQTQMKQTCRELATQKSQLCDSVNTLSDCVTKELAQFTVCLYMFVCVYFAIFA